MSEKQTMLKITHPLPKKITLDQFDAHALRVVEVLDAAGFDAYIVGGGVRDLLLGKMPKDFDVATNATPDEIRALFSNCRLIGKRFRLAHIYYHRHIIEVATFRGSHEDADVATDAVTRDGMITRDNVFGSMEEDAKRRDFTINALYFQPKTLSIVDYVGGLLDIDAGIIRSIGDAKIRFQEDPVRILRALRFKTKLGFKIDESSAKAIASLHHHLDKISSSRIFEEYRKLFFHGQAYANFCALIDDNLLEHFFPAACDDIDDPLFRVFTKKALDNTDVRIKRQLGINPAFLIACFLRKAFVRAYKHKMDHDKLPLMSAVHIAASEVIFQQQKAIGLPKRFSMLIKDIWVMQFALEKRHPKRVPRLLQQRSFRAAYDFLILRVELQEVPDSLALWWTNIQSANAANQKKMLQALLPHPKRRRRKRNRQ